MKVHKIMETEGAEQSNNSEEIELKKQQTWSGTNYKGFLEKASLFQIPKKVLTYWGHD